MCDRGAFIRQSRGRRALEGARFAARPKVVAPDVGAGGCVERIRPGWRGGEKGWTEEP